MKITPPNPATYQLFQLRTLLCPQTLLQFHSPKSLALQQLLQLQLPNNQLFQLRTTTPAYAHHHLQLLQL